MLIPFDEVKFLVENRSKRGCVCHFSIEKSTERYFLCLYLSFRREKVSSNMDVWLLNFV